MADHAYLDHRELPAARQLDPIERLMLSIHAGRAAAVQAERGRVNRVGHIEYRHASLSSARPEEAYLHAFGRWPCDCDGPCTCPARTINEEASDG